MTLNELKAAILENGTGIYFEFNGKKCGVDGFFDGKSIVDLLDIIEPSLY